MLLRAGGLAGLVLVAMAGTARAEDWRAVSTSHHDVVFVDSDSVRRQPDGRIVFRARHRLGENESNRDFGYDRIDLAVTGRCKDRASGARPVSGVRKYFLRNKAVAAPDWREEDLADEGAELVETICRGFIGHRRFADLDRAMSEYGEHDSLERLAASVTGETELIGVVVQGWEMNAVSLCGPDACREEPPAELCWLEGNINVPAPAGAPEWVDGGPRRDSAGAAFRGRVHRSRDGKGFGHMAGFACLVEATGPARFVEVAKTRADQPQAADTVARPEAAAAHQAFVDTIKSAASVGLASGRRRWEVDDFTPGAGGDGICYSVPRFKGASLDFHSPVLGWPGVERISREGAEVVLVSRSYDPDLSFYFPSFETARGAEAFLRKLASRGVAAISQKGAIVTLRYSGGGQESFRFDDPAGAVQAAGLAERLRGREIAEVKTYGRQVTAIPLRRISLTLPDEALARRVEERMQALRGACAAGKDGGEFGGE
ncbi:MAG: hypothetical protein ABWX67_17095 [Allosphingosinicella sp.]